MKIIGALLIIFGCGGVGFSMCREHRQLERSLENLAGSLDLMVWELNYRMPPLGELCRTAANAGKGSVSIVLAKLADELEAQVMPDATACMMAALAAVPGIPTQTAEHFKTLGTSLGRFDLQGQIAGLEATAALCRRDLERLSRNRELRLRNYQTLGICAGVALVIILL